jgi:hypothetical protein
VNFGRRSLWLLAPFAVGMILRLWRLPQQVLGGDEVHAVLTALHQPLGSLFTTYFPSDPCIPLTALYRLWSLAGGELTEMGLRMPVLATAAAFLIGLPILLARHLGRRTATAFAWLAAISPGLVLYGRIVRSYMPVTLWGSLAAVAFWGWWRTGRRRWAACYLLTACLALWFHLGAGPFVVAPFLFATGDLVFRWVRPRGGEGSSERPANRHRQRGSPPGWRALTALGGLTAAAFLMLLLPAADSLRSLAADKRIEQTVPASVIGGALQMAAGTVGPWPAILFWVVALLGLVLLLRRRPALAIYTLTLVAVQTVGVRVLSPMGLGHPVILFRYHLIALPVVLLWGATALAGPEELEEPRKPAPSSGARTSIRGSISGSRILASTVLVLFVAGLVLAGPFPSWEFLHGSFVHHNDFFAYVLPRPRLVEEQIPAIYRRLASSTQPGPVLEYPWTYFWNRNQAVPLYQRLHRRDVLVAPAEEVLADPRLDLRNAVVPDRQAFLASCARFLVLHLDPGREEARVLTGPGRLGMLGRMPAERKRLATVAHRMAGWLERGWGPPDYRDRWVRVWDLEEVRSRISSGESSEVSSESGSETLSSTDEGGIDMGSSSPKR